MSKRAIDNYTIYKRKWNVLAKLEYVVIPPMSKWRENYKLELIHIFDPYFLQSRERIISIFIGSEAKN